MSKKKPLKERNDHLISSPSYQTGQRKWYIFYLRPRSENVVYQVLMNLEYNVFFPTITSLRIWKNRQKKKIKIPLFPNYLFVYTYEHELFAIKALPKVVTFLTSEGRPLTISEKEIEGIKRMLGLEKYIAVETAFNKGEQVRIVSGPLMGYEGVLVKQHGKNRFGIQLKAINHTVFVDITLSDLEKL